MTRRAILKALASGAVAKRPNIVFILGDDVRFDDLGCAGHPFVRTPHLDRIAQEGVQFRNAFVTTSLCSPSRASFLTGQYACRHGIIDNTDRSPASHRLVTFPRLLHDNGYETAYVGKWHMGVDDSPRPGFDHWVSVRGQGEYFDPWLNENGAVRQVPGYVTDIFSDRATEFLERKRNRPFLLYLAHKAVHPNTRQNADGSVEPIGAGGFAPAPRHIGLYRDAKIPRRPNYARPPLDKPALLRAPSGLPPLGAGTVTNDQTIRNRLRLLAAIDEGVGRIFQTLERSSELDRTIVVFAGDNGYFYGEHGLSAERRLAFEESVRIPLLMRYPPSIRRNHRLNEFALNIDLAPTLLDFAGVERPPALQGRSLRPLLDGRRIAWRKSFLIEYYSDRVMPRIRNMGFDAVRTRTAKYTHFQEIDGADELYNLERDPYELSNLAGRSESGPLLDEMRRELARLRRQMGPRP